MKRCFTVGVFAVPAIVRDCEVRIKVNVRTDQERQKELAGIDSEVKIVDLLGGGVKEGESFLEALVREVEEESGCQMKSLGEFRGPLVAGNDMAFWMPIELIGDPRPTEEALEHIWISRDEFEAENQYRCVGKLGKEGRMGGMIREAFSFYGASVFTYSP